MNPGYSLRIWLGDHSVVSEVRNDYLQHPIPEHLLQYAMTLYSFRYESVLADELEQLLEELVDLASLWQQVLPMDIRLQETVVDQADMISTYLVWLSARDTLSTEKRELAADAATRLLEKAIRSPGARSHTKLLLMLTQVQMQEDTERFASQLNVIYFAIKESKIDDANQKARVIRKFGILESRVRWFSGKRAVFHSMVLPGLSKSVRMKSLAALLGVKS